MKNKIDIDFINMRAGTRANIPEPLRDLIAGEYLLTRKEQMQLTHDISSLLQIRRIDPIANILIHLTVAANKQMEQILFLEKAVQQLTMDNIRLKAELKEHGAKK
jgi:hypothetical protein